MGVLCEVRSESSVGWAGQGRVSRKRQGSHTEHKMLINRALKWDFLGMRCRCLEGREGL